MILWNAELTKRLACSDKDKLALPQIIQEMLAVSDKARHEGILPFASGDESSSQPAMLRYGFKLIAEGLSPDVLEEILAVYLSTSTFTGFEFLKQCVYVEALLSIAAGDSRDLLLRKLAPYCGAEKAYSLLKAMDSENGTKNL